MAVGGRRHDAYTCSDGRAQMLIDCNRCAMQGTRHCRDCVVTAILEPHAGEGALVIDADEERALRELASAGLVPAIRMRHRRETA